MTAFDAYTREAELLLDLYPPRTDRERTQLEALLDGGPNRTLRTTLSVVQMRKRGAFFTGKSLADKLVGGIPSSPILGRVSDPTCGAGDLLLAAAAGLPIRGSLVETLSEWGTRLAGSDTTSEFVRLARARVAVLALQRGVNHDRLGPNELERILPMISEGNALAEKALYENADCILLNPPFGAMVSPPTCSWASGKITAAALFADRAVAMAGTGTHLAMILPDVLRSGSRYRRWREYIERQAKVLKVELHGLFDAATDVDVFLLHLIKTARVQTRGIGRAIALKETRRSETIGDFLHVNVGRVVSYRDRGRGPMRPFIAARALPKWRVWRGVERQKRTDGKGFLPPFVVVRRTSRPGDAHRAVGTIIAGREEVAVENHLIVLSPKDGRLTTCKELLARLKTERTNRWLDKRIRCRHLTVSAVKDLPWWD